MKKKPHFKHENELSKKGYLVVGIDEVGRGAFAGPLVLAGVIFQPKNHKEELYIRKLGINDSKQLSSERREELAKIIKRKAVAYTYASINVTTINKVGIGKSTQIAVRKIAAKLCKKSGDRKLFVLMDAFYVKYVKGVGLKNQRAIIKGDCISISIAAASVIAKVKRDSYMRKISSKYEGYGFGQNKGYGTLEHRNAIKKLGKTDIHREAYIRNI